MFRRPSHSTDSAATAHETGSASQVQWIEVRNPATGEPVGRVPATAPDDVPAIVARARAAQEKWRATPFADRARVLQRFHDLVLSRTDQLLDTIQSESGKARRDALGEVLTVAGTARHYLIHGEGYVRDRSVRAAIPGITSASVIYKPRGVVGMITPWNFPLLLGVADALPALLAGNAVVTKPAEMTPLSTMLGIELLVESGLDPDLMIAVNGKGSVVGRELIDHVDYVGFTGSTQTGRAVAQQAGERLIPCSLELGGKNPMIVLEGTSIDAAVTGLMNGAFCNSGQTCISIERVLVQDSIWDEFVSRAIDRTRELTIGWSRGWDMDMGSLISEEHAATVLDHIADATQRGATVLAGGKGGSDINPDLRGSFVEPTLLTDVTEDMRICREETFGPVAALYRVADAEEAIALANDTEYGLNAAVWAGSTRRAREIARQLDVGSAGINSTLLIYNTFHAPMGGVGNSGIGRRHGAAGIRRYMSEESIVTSFATGGGYESIQRLVTNDRRARVLTSTFRLLRHVPGMR